MPIRTEPVLPEDEWQLRLEPPTTARASAPSPWTIPRS